MRKALSLVAFLILLTPGVARAQQRIMGDRIMTGAVGAAIGALFGGPPGFAAGAVLGYTVAPELRKITADAKPRRALRRRVARHVAPAPYPAAYPYQQGVYPTGYANMPAQQPQPWPQQAVQQQQPWPQQIAQQQQPWPQQVAQAPLVPQAPRYLADPRVSYTPYATPAPVLVAATSPMPMVAQPYPMAAPQVQAVVPAPVQAAAPARVVRHVRQRARATPVANNSRYFIN